MWAAADNLLACVQCCTCVVDQEVDSFLCRKAECGPNIGAAHTVAQWSWRWGRSGLSFDRTGSVHLHTWTSHALVPYSQVWPAWTGLFTFVILVVFLFYFFCLAVPTHKSNRTETDCCEFHGEHFINGRGITHLGAIYPFHPEERHQSRNSGTQIWIKTQFATTDLLLPAHTWTWSLFPHFVRVSICLPAFLPACC